MGRKKSNSAKNFLAKKSPAKKSSSAKTTGSLSYAEAAAKPAHKTSSAPAVPSKVWAVIHVECESNINFDDSCPSVIVGVFSTKDKANKAARQHCIDSNLIESPRRCEDDRSEDEIEYPIDFADKWFCLDSELGGGDGDGITQTVYVEEQLVK